jgi:hypothetical protein
VDEKTLITNAEKADAIASKFAESHNNTTISPLSNMVVRASCSVLRCGGFNTDASTSTSPREIKDVVKKVRNGKVAMLITSY